jgi:transposase
MKRFVEGEDRLQGALLAHCLDDYVTENNPVRVIEAFINELDLATLGFDGVVPETTGRPAYHPATLLKIDLYGYLNRIPSSRRLERETQRNIELMWLTGRLMPDFKTIADFRKDHGPAIRATCRQFVMLCRRLDLFSESVIAIDGSGFKAVNTRDKNYTHGAIERRMEQVEASIARYLSALDTADRQEGEVAEAKSIRLKDKLARLKQQMQHLPEMEIAVQAAPDRQISLTDPDARANQTSWVPCGCGVGWGSVSKNGGRGRGRRSARPGRGADHAAEILGPERRVLVGEHVGVDSAESRLGLVMEAVIEGLDDLFLEAAGAWVRADHGSALDVRNSEKEMPSTSISTPAVTSAMTG